MHCKLNFILCISIAVDMDKEGEPLAHITMITVTGKLDITTVPVNEKKEKGMCKPFT